MPILQPITPANVQAYKSTRLAALKDSPTAFGSTYARESQLTDADWLKRATDSNGQKSIAFLAMEAADAVGIVAAFLEDHDPQIASIVSMWVHSAHRRHGIGRLLIDAVQTWAASRRVAHLHLTVTDVNKSAIAFYRRLGFSMTGEILPYPNDPNIFEYVMSRPVTPP